MSLLSLVVAHVIIGTASVRKFGFGTSDSGFSMHYTFLNTLSFLPMQCNVIALLDPNDKMLRMVNFYLVG